MLCSNHLGLCVEVTTYGCNPSPFRSIVRRVRILITLSAEDTQCLLANAPNDCIVLKALLRAIQSSSSRPDELRVYCDAAVAAEIKRLAELHCPSAVTAIENAIRRSLELN